MGDNAERLKQIFKLALSRSEVIILTGGLGPTQDDITKETVSAVLGRRLVPDQASLDDIEDFFRKRGRKMTKNNLKQACLPEGCTIVRNSAGTAPGCIIEDSGKTIVLLPGPPSEMKPMFEETVMPYLAAKSDCRLESVYLRIFGIGESAVEDEIMDRWAVIIHHRFAKDDDDVSAVRRTVQTDIIGRSLEIKWRLATRYSAMAAARRCRAV